jgi:hypothetical protein
MKKFDIKFKLCYNKKNTARKGSDGEKISCLKCRGFVTYVPSEIKLCYIKNLTKNK